LAADVVLLAPPGTDKTHMALGIGVKAAHAEHPAPFATATK